MIVLSKPVLKKRSFLAFFLLLFTCLACGSAENGVLQPESSSAPLFNSLFHEIMDNLLENYWVGNGDWDGDAQGDDVAFGPWLCYSLGADQGIQEFAEMGTRTVDYEMDQLEKLFNGELFDPRRPVRSFVAIMKAVLGGPALIDGYGFTKEPDYLEVLDLGLDLVTRIGVTFPGVLALFVFDPVVVLGIAADMDLDAFEVTQDPKYLSWALAVLKVAENRFWDDGNGYYGRECWDWPQATMLMALAAAFRFTQDPIYRERAERLLETVEETLWDGDSPEGGWYGHDRVVEESKALSGNNIFTRALLDWYELTGEHAYLQRAVDTFRFLEQVLYADRILWHHWTEEEGRDDEFCTGCNLMTLGNLYRLNRLQGTPVRYAAPVSLQASGGPGP